MGGRVKSSGLGIILMAEDNEVDVLMTRRAFEKVGLLNPVHVVADARRLSSIFQARVSTLIAASIHFLFCFCWI
jgi:hypothetical protein